LNSDTCRFLYCMLFSLVWHQYRAGGCALIRWCLSAICNLDSETLREYHTEYDLLGYFPFISTICISLFFILFSVLTEIMRQGRKQCFCLFDVVVGGSPLWLVRGPLMLWSNILSHACELWVLWSNILPHVWVMGPHCVLRTSALVSC
jgi:hypothetical protein